MDKKYLFLFLTNLRNSSLIICMAIVTFTSDLGMRDAYVAIVKARILTLNPNQIIIDISHDVKAANLADGAFILGSSFAAFPKGTVHLVAIDSIGRPGNKYIATEIDGHYFIGADNGLFSLISNNLPSGIVELEKPDNDNFPARDVFADAAVKLSSGTDINDLGEPLDEMHRLLGRQVKATRKEIAGHVIKVDHFGNLITSIPKVDFDILSKDKNYTIGFGRETCNSVNTSSNEVEAGDCYVLFNFLGLMEIGIRNGNASSLLGLDFDSPVWIKFEE